MFKRYVHAPAAGSLFVSRSAAAVQLLFPAGRAGLDLRAGAALILLLLDSARWQLHADAPAVALGVKTEQLCSGCIAGAAASRPTRIAAPQPGAAGADTNRLRHSRAMGGQPAMLGRQHCSRRHSTPA